MMIDVTDVGTAETETEVVLIGSQDTEEIGAEQLAALCNTISYEIVSRISPDIPRFVVSPGGDVRLADAGAGRDVPGR
jgi:alanine racemase